MKKVSGDLPFGWEKKVEGDGRIIFKNVEKNIQSFTDPRLAFAQEEQAVGPLRQRFDASSKAFSVLHGRDLSGKVALITGCSSGIGLETAKSLAFHGCEIIFACRNSKIAAQAIESLDNEQKGLKLSYFHLDLASLRSCSDFCKNIKLRYKHIDYLILNAGVFALPYSITEDDLETTFQGNFTKISCQSNIY